MRNHGKHLRSLIGLDIGRSSVKAVQVTAQSRGPRLDGTLCIRRAQDGYGLQDDEAERLIRIMRRRGLDATRIALVAQSDALISTSINLPSADRGASRDAIVKMELTRAHRLVPGGFEYAWWDLPASASGGKVAQAHAVALQHAKVDPTLACIDRLGLEVARTVPGSVALQAAAQRRPIDPRRIVAVMDLGSRAAHLVLLHAGRVVHERDLPEFNATGLQQRLQEHTGVGAHLVTAALGRYGLSDEPEGVICSELGVMLHEAVAELCEQIGMSFAFISHLYPDAELGPLLMVGGPASVPGLAQTLSRELELEASVMVPADLCANPHALSEACDPRLTAALGAALTMGGTP
ncbi:MAG: pilus assembly protein PilM [Phycisphaeraceae bacterium]